MKAPPEAPKVPCRFTCGQCGQPCPWTREMWNALARQIVSACDGCLPGMLVAGWQRLRFDSAARPLNAKPRAVQVGRSALPAGDRE